MLRSAFHLAETVQMGLAPVYVYDDMMADSRGSFVPREVGRGAFHFAETVYVHVEVMADSRVNFAPRVERSAFHLADTVHNEIGASLRVRRWSMSTVQGFV